MTDYDQLFELKELAVKDADNYPKKREWHTSPAFYTPPQRYVQEVAVVEIKLEGN